jgi:hypothetical protein
MTKRSVSKKPAFTTVSLASLASVVGGEDTKPVVSTTIKFSPEYTRYSKASGSVSELP